MTDLAPAAITFRRPLRAVAAMLCVVVAVSGCGIFGGDDDDELKPAELLEFKPELNVRRLWSAKLGEGTEFLRIGLSPAGDGNRVYAASYDGKVSAFNPQTGARAWRVETDTILSAGPGVGGGLVVVAGYDGDLIALQSEDGSVAWRTNINGESLSRPLIHNDAVVVYTIDGRLGVYSAFDGSERWNLEQTLPALTLRGSSTPIVVGNYVISGFDNGRLIAMSLLDGAREWEAILTPSSGRSDLERLADVDGAMAAVGQDIYAAGYNGQTAAIAAESGQPLWGRELSSSAGVAADWNNVYVVDNNGEIAAMLRRDGSDLWRQDALLRREPTAPVVFGTSVVVGDFEGYVHFFSNFDGRPVARVRVGKGMISGAPVAIGNHLFVQSESGNLTAFTIDMPERRADTVAETEDDG